MKKRSRNAPTNPFYSNEPAVAVSNMADKPMISNANLANKTNKVVDRSPGRLSGLVGFASKSKPRSAAIKVSSPKLGTAAKVPTQGSLKSSGHPGAHRIGIKPKF